MFRWCIAVAVITAALAVPCTARAASGWDWPVTGGPALLYGAAYAGDDGGSHTHGGLDITAGEGSAVSASVSGEVVFSGRVPAGEGVRTWAVTVLTAEGLRVSYLPLDSVRVRTGQEVDAGQELGALSGSGDASGAGPHLHLGVKRGSASLDPLAFLSARTSLVPGEGGAASPGTGSLARTSSAGSASARVAPRVGSVGSARAPAVARDPGAAAATPAAVQAALRTLAQARPLARVETLASVSRVDLAHVRADLRAAQGVALTWAARLGLMLLGCGCAWPVLRAVRAQAAGLGAATEPARRRG